ncbi:hypothetical protein [Streptomyces violascens]|uniref:hypothetical protein n=1 Tax=Streptomyces violascens TaxID=67381 RepID=UPI00167B9661|nr:hypothetical protein [Streptomyces violascens]
MSASYTSVAFADACAKAGVTRSMSAVGSSADNALAIHAATGRDRQQDTLSNVI